MTPKIMILSNLPDAALQGLLVGMTRAAEQLGTPMRFDRDPTEFFADAPARPDDRLVRAYEDRGRQINTLIQQHNQMGTELTAARRALHEQERVTAELKAAFDQFRAENIRVVKPAAKRKK